MRRPLSSSKSISALTAMVALFGCASRRSQVVVAAPPPTAEFVVAAPGVTGVTGVETVSVAPQPATPAQVVVVADPSSTQQNGSVENWATRHAAAAKELGTWAHANPEAAKFVFEYDGHHPERNRELVLWAVYHPGEDIMTFAAKHPGWEWFDKVAARHRAGTDQFLEWTRHNPVAAEELVGHPRGLLWVGEHLYASEWRP